VFDKNLIVQQVYDRDGRLLYTDGQIVPELQARGPGSRNAIFVGGTLVDGRHEGGRFIDAYKSLRREVLEQYRDEWVFIRNVEFSAVGGYIFPASDKTYIWTKFKGYENAKGNLAVIPPGEVVPAQVYDQNGRLIYDVVEAAREQGSLAGISPYVWMIVLLAAVPVFILALLARGVYVRSHLSRLKVVGNADARGPPGNIPRILVVEDSPAVAEAFRQAFLRQGNVEVIVVPDYPAAVEQVYSAPHGFQTVITDMNLGGVRIYRMLDGFHFALWVRANFPQTHIILHSKAFRRFNPGRLFVFLLRIRSRASRNGITALPKPRLVQVMAGFPLQEDNRGEELFGVTDFFVIAGVIVGIIGFAILVYRWRRSKEILQIIRNIKTNIHEDDLRDIPQRDWRSPVSPVFRDMPISPGLVPANNRQVLIYPEGARLGSMETSVRLIDADWPIDMSYAEIERRLRLIDRAIRQEVLSNVMSPTPHTFVFRDGLIESILIWGQSLPGLNVERFLDSMLRYDKVLRVASILAGIAGLKIVAQQGTQSMAVGLTTYPDRVPMAKLREIIRELSAVLERSLEHEKEVRHCADRDNDRDEFRLTDTFVVNPVAVIVLVTGMIVIGTALIWARQEAFGHEKLGDIVIPSWRRVLVERMHLSGPAADFILSVVEETFFRGMPLILALNVWALYGFWAGYGTLLIAGFGFGVWSYMKYFEPLRAPPRAVDIILTVNTLLTFFLFPFQIHLFPPTLLYPSLFLEWLVWIAVHQVVPWKFKSYQKPRMLHDPFERRRQDVQIRPGYNPRRVLLLKGLWYRTKFEMEGVLEGRELVDAGFWRDDATILGIKIKPFLSESAEDGLVPFYRRTRREILQEKNHVLRDIFILSWLVHLFSEATSEKKIDIASHSYGGRIAIVLKFGLKYILRLMEKGDHSDELTQMVRGAPDKMAHIFAGDVPLDNKVLSISENGRKALYYLLKMAPFIPQSIFIVVHRLLHNRTLIKFIRKHSPGLDVQSWLDYTRAGERFARERAATLWLFLPWRPKHFHYVAAEYRRFAQKGGQLWLVYGEKDTKTPVGPNRKFAERLGLTEGVQFHVIPGMRHNKILRDSQFLKLLEEWQAATGIKIHSEEHVEIVEAQVLRGRLRGRLRTVIKRMRRAGWALFGRFRKESRSEGSGPERKDTGENHEELLMTAWGNECSFSVIAFLFIFYKAFPIGFNVLQNLLDHSFGEIFAFMERDNRDSSIAMAEEHMTASLSDALKSQSFKDSNDDGRLERCQSHLVVISTSWRPMNFRGGRSIFLTSKHNRIASLILLSRTGMVLAWVWHPFSEGTLAINMPSSSFSIRTGNSYFDMGVRLSLSHASAFIFLTFLDLIMVSTSDKKYRGLPLGSQEMIRSGEDEFLFSVLLPLAIVGWIRGLLYGQGQITQKEIDRAVGSSNMRVRLKREFPEVFETVQPHEFLMSGIWYAIIVIVVIVIARLSYVLYILARRYPSGAWHLDMNNLPRNIQRTYARILEQGTLGAGSRIVSVGPGDPFVYQGYAVPWEYLFTAAGAEVIVYEPNARFHEKWRRLAEEWSSLDGKLTVMPLEEAEFRSGNLPGGKIDAVVMMSVLSDARISRARRNEMVLDVQRTVRPDGYFIVGRYNFFRPIALIEWMRTRRAMREIAPTLEAINAGSGPVHKWVWYRMDSAPKRAGLKQYIDQGFAWLHKIIATLIANRSPPVRTVVNIIGLFLPIVLIILVPPILYFLPFEIIDVLFPEILFLIPSIFLAFAMEFFGWRIGNYIIRKKKQTRGISRIIAEQTFRGLRQTVDRQSPRDWFLAAALRETRGPHYCEHRIAIFEGGKNYPSRTIYYGEAMTLWPDLLRYMFTRRSIGFLYDDILAFRPSMDTDVEAMFWAVWGDYETLKRGHLYPSMVPYILAHLSTTSFLAVLGLFGLLFSPKKLRLRLVTVGRLFHEFLRDDDVEDADGQLDVRQSAESNAFGWLVPVVLLSSFILLALLYRLNQERRGACSRINWQVVASLGIALVLIAHALIRKGWFEGFDVIDESPLRYLRRMDYDGSIWSYINMQFVRVLSIPTLIAGGYFIARIYVSIASWMTGIRHWDDIRFSAQASMLWRAGVAMLLLGYVNFIEYLKFYRGEFQILLGEDVRINFYVHLLSAAISYVGMRYVSFASIVKSEVPLRGLTDGHRDEDEALRSVFDGGMLNVAGTVLKILIDGAFGINYRRMDDVSFAVPALLSRASMAFPADGGLGIPVLEQYALRLRTDAGFLAKEKEYYQNVLPALRDTRGARNGIFPLERQSNQQERLRIEEEVRTQLAKRLLIRKQYLVYFVGPSTGEEVLSFAGIIYQILSSYSYKGDLSEWQINLIGLEPNLWRLAQAQQKIYVTFSYSPDESVLMREQLLATGAFEETDIAETPWDTRERFREEEFVFRPRAEVAQWISYYQFNLLDRNLTETVRHLFGAADMAVSRNTFRWAEQESIPLEAEDLAAFENLRLLARLSGLVVTESSIENASAAVEVGREATRIYSVWAVFWVVLLIGILIRLHTARQSTAAPALSLGFTELRKLVGGERFREAVILIAFAVLLSPLWEGPVFRWGLPKLFDWIMAVSGTSAPFEHYSVWLSALVFFAAHVPESWLAAKEHVRGRYFGNGYVILPKWEVRRNFFLRIAIQAVGTFLLYDHFIARDNLLYSIQVHSFLNTFILFVHSVSKQRTPDAVLSLGSSKAKKNVPDVWSRYVLGSVVEYMRRSYRVSEVDRSGPVNIVVLEPAVRDTLYTTFSTVRVPEGPNLFKAGRRNANLAFLNTSQNLWTRLRQLVLWLQVQRPGAAINRLEIQELLSDPRDETQPTMTQIRSAVYELKRRQEWPEVALQDARFNEDRLTFPAFRSAIKRIFLQGRDDYEFLVSETGGHLTARQITLLAARFRAEGHFIPVGRRRPLGGNITRDVELAEAYYQGRLVASGISPNQVIEFAEVSYEDIAEDPGKGLRRLNAAFTELAGPHFRDLRAEAGINQGRLAKRAAISVKDIVALELGHLKKPLSLTQMTRIRTAIEEWNEERSSYPASRLWEENIDLLEGLPPQQRRVTKGHLLDGKSFSVLADEMGLSPKTVANLFEMGSRRLAKTAIAGNRVRISEQAAAMIIPGLAKKKSVRRIIQDLGLDYDVIKILKPNKTGISIADLLEALHEGYAGVEFVEADSEAGDKQFSVLIEAVVILGILLVLGVLKYQLNQVLWEFRLRMRPAGILNKLWLFPIVGLKAVLLITPPVYRILSRQRVQTETDLEELSRRELLDLFRKVWVLRTGGTLEMAGEAGRRSVSAVEFLIREHAKRVVLAETAFTQLPDSSNLGPHEWNVILAGLHDMQRRKRAVLTELLRRGIDPGPAGGIVLTTGTDTVDELGLVLSLELEGFLDFPVVITAAAKPPTAKDTDAFANFDLATRVAMNRMLPPHVYFAYGGVVHLASRIKKFIAGVPKDASSATKDKQLEHFESYGDVVGHDSRLSFVPGLWIYRFKTERPHWFRPAESPIEFGVAEHLPVSKAMPKEVFEQLIPRLIWFRRQGHRVGLILHGSIEGHYRKFGFADDIYDLLVDWDIPVLTGATNSWNFEMIRYDMDITFPYGLTHEKARTKLAWLLGRGLSLADIYVEMRRNHAGEISPLPHHPLSHTYGTFPVNNPYRGQGVLIAYPGIRPEVFEETIALLYHFSGRAEKRLVIFGFGDGNLPVGNVALEARVLAWLEEQHPGLATRTRHYFEVDGKIHEITLRRLERSLSSALAGLPMAEAVQILSGYRLNMVAFIVDELVAEILREYPSCGGKRQDTSAILEILQRRYPVFVGVAEAEINIRKLRTQLSEHLAARPLSEFLVFMRGLFSDSSHNEILARRLIKDALMASDPLLNLLGRATDFGIAVEIRSTAARSLSDTQLYELGNMLLAVGVDSQVTKGWPAVLTPNEEKRTGGAGREEQLFGVGLFAILMGIMAGMVRITDINSATEEELSDLFKSAVPKEKTRRGLVRRIMEARPLRRIEDLQGISGIGPGVFAQIKSRIGVGEAVSREADSSVIFGELKDDSWDAWIKAFLALLQSSDGKMDALLQRSDSTRLHFANLQAGIRQAADRAPPGKPVLVLGAGGLRDIPQELFNSPKFPSIILIDINTEAVHEALRSRGLQHQINHRIHVVQWDLSMLDHRLIRSIVNHVQRSGSPQHAQQRIMTLLESMGETTAIRLPQGVVPGEFGLVVSSTLVPNSAHYVFQAVGELMSQRFGYGPDYGIPPPEIAYPVEKEIVRTHVRLLSQLISPDGVIYLATVFAEGDKDALTPEMVEGFHQAARVHAGLSMTSDVTEELFERQRTLIKRGLQEGRNAPLAWDHTGFIPILNMPDSFWVPEDMTVVDTDIWGWDNDNERDAIMLVQSLTMRRKNDDSEVAAAFFPMFSLVLVLFIANARKNAQAALEQWRKIGRSSPADVAVALLRIRRAWVDIISAMDLLRTNGESLSSEKMMRFKKIFYQLVLAYNEGVESLLRHYQEQRELAEIQEWLLEAADGVHGDDLLRYSIASLAGSPGVSLKETLSYIIRLLERGSGVMAVSFIVAGKYDLSNRQRSTIRNAGERMEKQLSEIDVPAPEIKILFMSGVEFWMIVVIKLVGAALLALPFIQDPTGDSDAAKAVKIFQWPQLILRRSDGYQAKADLSIDLEQAESASPRTVLVYIHGFMGPGTGEGLLSGMDPEHVIVAAMHRGEGAAGFRGQKLFSHYARNVEEVVRYFARRGHRVVLVAHSNGSMLLYHIFANLSKFPYMRLYVRHIVLTNPFYPRYIRQAAKGILQYVFLPNIDAKGGRALIHALSVPVSEGPTSMGLGPLHDVITRFGLARLVSFPISVVNGTIILALRPFWPDIKEWLAKVIWSVQGIPEKFHETIRQQYAAIPLSFFFREIQADLDFSQRLAGRAEEIIRTEGVRVLVIADLQDPLARPDEAAARRMGAEFVGLNSPHGQDNPFLRHLMHMVNLPFWTKIVFAFLPEFSGEEQVHPEEGETLLAGDWIGMMILMMGLLPLLRTVWSGSQEGDHVPGLLYGSGKITPEEVERAIASSDIREPFVRFIGADEFEGEIDIVRRFLKEHQSDPTIPSLAGWEEQLLGDLENTQVIQPEVEDRTMPGLVVKDHVALLSIVDRSGTVFLSKDFLDWIEDYTGDLLSEEYRRAVIHYVVSSMLFKYSDDFDVREVSKVRSRLQGKMFRRMTKAAFELYHSGRWRKEFSFEHLYEGIGRILLDSFRDHPFSIILLKGGRRGGLHPVVGRRIKELLDPYFVLVPGRRHRLELSQVVHRWGSEIVQRFFRRSGTLQFLFGDRFFELQPGLRNGPWSVTFAELEFRRILSLLTQPGQKALSGRKPKTGVRFGDVARFELVLEYLQSPAVGVLLFRKVPRAEVVEGLGIKIKGGTNIDELYEQNFVHRFVVERIREIIFAEMVEPEEGPLHGFYQFARERGLKDRSYFFGFLSPLHSPELSRSELVRELLSLPREDLDTFAAFIDDHLAQSDQGPVSSVDEN
jgi:L-asparaginase/Glu-tRNA(Gln) amidotransferase subunit D/pimeloyl-ACP methyl ester carboxylesterase/CheY-like chemotaxis protein